MHAQPSFTLHGLLLARLCAAGGGADFRAALPCFAGASQSTGCRPDMMPMERISGERSLRAAQNEPLASSSHLQDCTM